MSDVYPRCRGCGYDLTGLGLGEVEAVCPECGEVFDPRSPFVTRRWPPAGIVFVRLCWPGWIAVIIAGVLPRLGRFDGVESVALMLIAAGFLWPVLSAFKMAKRYAHPAEFRLVMAGLAVAGILGVLLVVALVMPVAIAFF